MERPKKIDDAEAWSMLKEQHNRMSHRKRDRAVGCPLMEGKDIQSAVWPLPERAIAQGDQQPKQEREGCGSHSAEPKIGTKIKYGHRPLLAGWMFKFVAVQCMVMVIDSHNIHCICILITIDHVRRGEALAPVCRALARPCSVGFAGRILQSSEPCQTFLGYSGTYGNGSTTNWFRSAAAGRDQSAAGAIFPILR